MDSCKKERRKYERYDTEVKIFFHVNYDIKTKVKFRLIDKQKHVLLPKRYLGLGRNISVEGIRFSSIKQLQKGDILFIEVYLPRLKNPIYMTGEVRWSEQTFVHPKVKYKFDTGVQLISVSGRPVHESIYYDRKNNVYWSIALDSIFGSFRKFMQRKK